MGQTEGAPADDRPRTLADLIGERRVADAEADMARERANRLARRLKLALARSGPVDYYDIKGTPWGYSFDGETLRVEFPGGGTADAELFDDEGRRFEGKEGE